MFRKLRPKIISANGGFSLIEIISVLSIISILDYTFVGPFMKTLTFKYDIATIRPIFKSYVNKISSFPQYMNGMPSGHCQVMWLIFTFI